MAGGIKGITVKIGGDTTELGRALSEATTKSTALQRELKGVNSLLKLDPTNITMLKQKSDLLKDSIAETERKLASLKEVMSKVKSGEIEMTEEEFRNLQREIASTEAKLKSLKTESGEFGSAFASYLSAIGDKLIEVGGKIEDVGKKLTPLSAAATAVLSGSIYMASEFQDAMAKVSTIADTSAVSLDDLTDQVMELSNQTGVSANEIAEATYNAISAGQDTADAVSFVANATSLARAGFTDTGSAIDILTTIMNAYGLEADEVTNVCDRLITTQNLGKTTVAELSSAMGKVIPTAKATNVNLDELCGAYAVMTSNGIATAETTTYLNSMLNELGKEGTTAADAFRKGTEHIKEGGLSMAEAMEMGWSLTDVLSILDEQAVESGTSINNMFGSAEAGKAAAVLWDNASRLNEAVDAMGQSANATEIALGKLETPSHTAEVAINQLKNSATNFGSTLLEALAPAIEKIASAIESVTTWFNNLSPGIQTAIGSVLAILAALGPCLVILGKIISFFGSILTLIPTLVTWFGTMKTAFAALSAILAANPIGLVIAALSALVAAFVYAYNHSETFRNIVNAAFQAVKTTVGNVVNALVTFFTSTLPSAFTALISKVQSVVSGIINLFSNLPGQMLNIGKNIIQGIINGITSMVSSLYSSIVNALSGLVSKAKSALGIHSPSTVFADVIGKQIPAGVAVGVKDNTDVAEDAINQMTDDLLGVDMNGATINRQLNATFSASQGASGGLQIMSMLQRIYERLSALKVILDSGALIGEIIDPIDEALSDRYHQTERGW